MRRSTLALTCGVALLACSSAPDRAAAPTEGAPRKPAEAAPAPKAAAERPAPAATPAAGPISKKRVFAYYSPVEEKIGLKMTQCARPAEGLAVTLVEKTGAATALIAVQAGRRDVFPCGPEEELAEGPDGFRFSRSCGPFSFDTISTGEGSTDYSVKGKFMGVVDIDELRAGEDAWCTFFAALAPPPEELAGATMLSCRADEGGSYEIHLVDRAGEEPEITLIRQGDGDVGLYQALTCGRDGKGYRCSGEFLVQFYPEAGSGERFDLRVAPKGDGFEISGEFREEKIPPSACLRWGL